MAVYSPESLGIKPPAGGFAQGGWYSGRQYWAGTLSDPGVIHPQSDQPGAGQAVSPEVVAAGAVAQGVTPEQQQAYLQQQRQAGAGVTPVAGQVSPTTPAGTTAGISGFQQPQVPQLEGLKKQYETEAGLAEKQTVADAKFSEITDVRDALKEREAEINENPFLSEASRVGRIRRLTEMANREIENLNLEWAKLQDEVTKANADVTIRLNLATGQYSLNMQAYQTALSQFNTLLGMGALDTATGNDIAQLALSAGIPTTMIESAIKARKDKAVETQVITATDAAGNVTAVVLNTQTGAIISQTSLGKIAAGQAAPSAAKVTEATFKARAGTITGVSTPAGWVGEFPLLVAEFAPYYTLQEIYRLYAASELGQKWGTPKESATEIQKIYDLYRGTAGTKLGL